MVKKLELAVSREFTSKPQHTPYGQKTDLTFHQPSFKSSQFGSVANNLFNLKKVEYPIIAKTRCVVLSGFFECVGE
jgi:hypothetical protein